MCARRSLAYTLIALSWIARGYADSHRFFPQAAAVQLDRQFPNPDITYLLTDDQGHVVAQRWPHADLPVAPGSLVKPFTAVAYGEQHAGNFPEVLCQGSHDRCWLPRGHGRLNFEEAIAESCNAYFCALSAGLDRRRAQQSFAKYGLAGPAATDRDNSTLVGLNGAWKETPAALARAYWQLESEQRNATQGRIAKGMSGAASRGTARSVDAALGTNAALAKTGTAQCSHFPRGAADGFAIVFYPAVQPRLQILVRVHGLTGARSAALAGEMLRSIGAGIASSNARPGAISRDAHGQAGGQ